MAGTGSTQVLLAQVHNTFTIPIVTVHRFQKFETRLIDLFKPKYQALA